MNLAELPRRNPDGQTVSVALATLNGGAYIDRQLQSICQQSRQVDEIIVADDGSSDNTSDLVKALAASRPIAVTVLPGVGGRGVAANFERAVRACRGDIIFFSDQDDVWHQNKVQRTLESFRRQPGVSVLFGDARLIDEDGRELAASLFDVIRLTSGERRQIHGDQAFEVLLTRNVATGATMALRRSVLERVFPVPEGWLHDEWIAIVVAAMGGVDLIEEPLIDYRQHGANVSGTVPLRWRQRLALLGRTDRAMRSLLARRASSLVEYLAGSDAVCADRRIAATEKQHHLQLRAGLPRQRLRRVGPITRELVAGGYERYSTGWRAALRDLVQPLS